MENIKYDLTVLNFDPELIEAIIGKLRMQIPEVKDDLPHFELVPESITEAIAVIDAAPNLPEEHRAIARKIVQNKGDLEISHFDFFESYLHILGMGNFDRKIISRMREIATTPVGKAFPKHTPGTFIYLMRKIADSRPQYHHRNRILMACTEYLGRCIEDKPEETTEAELST